MQLIQFSKFLPRIKHSLNFKFPCFFTYHVNPNEEDSHTLELNDEHYLTSLTKEFKDSYKIKSPTRFPGFATKEGTLKYSQSRKDIVHEKHFRVPYHSDILMSSIGLGTYMGAPDENDDLKMFNAMVDSVNSGGINVIDTSINYRYMKSERSVGAALRYLISSNQIERNQLFICSKGGYVPEDADQGIPGQVVIKNLIEKKLIDNEDFVGACHCMHPNFLEDQLERTLDNIGVETLDLYYLQNACESQLPLIGEHKFFERLAKSFEFFEKKIQQGKIKNYGLATWVCFREKSENAGLYLSLEKVMELAQKIGGPKHGLKFIQMPINIMMPEAFAEQFQEITENGVQKKERLLTVARKHKINVISCSPLLQGTMIQLPMPSEIFKCRNVGAKHLQFVRSIPAESLITTLVGQKKNRHTKMNLEIIQHAPLEPEEFWSFLIPPHVRKQMPDEPIDPKQQ